MLNTDTVSYDWFSETTFAFIVIIFPTIIVTWIAAVNYLDTYDSNFEN